MGLFAAPSAPATPPELVARWRAEWPKALAAWSSYTLLREPTFLENERAAKAEGMAGEIATIRLTDQSIFVNLLEVERKGLGDLPLPVLAHEIGHHVYVPGNLADHARLLAILKPVLAGLADDVPGTVANLYGDILLNDRLHRGAGIEVHKIYQKLRAAASGEPASEAWRVYTRACEILWRQPAQSLAPLGITHDMEVDAHLLARLVRHFAGDWLRGARRFAGVLYPYLLHDQEDQRRTFQKLGLADTKGAGRPAPGASATDAVPDGLSAIDPAETDDGADFDAEFDPPLDADEAGAGRAAGKGPARAPATPTNSAPAQDGPGRPGQQFREPHAYGEVLKGLGLDLDAHAVTTRYYRERALPYLIPYPQRRAPRAVEPLAEGYETWEPGTDLDALDLFGSVLRSPHIVPGVTTVERVYGEVPGAEPGRVPVDLDIYVDSSGSMPNPGVNTSYLALAGTILALSALRVGARVQATLWSGARQFETTRGFVRDERKILGIITGYIGGSTAFPLHLLRDTYAQRRADEAPAHIVVISDDGADTMLAPDEKQTGGGDVCKRALERARGGGTLVLNLAQAAWPPRERFVGLGWRVHRVQAWADLVAFARAFVRDTYEEKA